MIGEFKNKIREWKGEISRKASKWIGELDKVPEEEAKFIFRMFDKNKDRKIDTNKGSGLEN